MGIKSFLRVGVASLGLAFAAGFAGLGASAVAQSLQSEAAANGGSWPGSNQAHRDIFCGAPGTETSREYAEALKRRLDEIVMKEGGTHAQAIERLRAITCRT